MHNNKKKTASYALGLAAEFFAAFILILKGHRILCMRYKTPVGEIDIVAQKGNRLVFVEVKARKRLDDALESVSQTMRRRIARAAGHFISGHPSVAGLQMRFDLFVLAPPLSWQHLDNAWQSST